MGADGRLLVASHAYDQSLPSRVTAKIAPLLQKERRQPCWPVVQALSHVVEESQGVALALEMAGAGMRVIGHDRLASDGARNAFRDKALVAESIEAALVDAALVAVATLDAPFRLLKPQDFLAGKESVTVVDCWRSLDPTVADHPRITYLSPEGMTADWPTPSTHAPDVSAPWSVALR